MIKIPETVASNWRNPAFWMTSSGRWAAGALAATTAAAVAQQASVSWWALLLVAGGAAIAGVAVAVLSCQWYMRSGRGFRVGVCLDGVGIDPSEIKRTQEELDTLASSQKLQEHIVLKRVPKSFVTPVERAGKTCHRYGLSMTAWLEVSSTTTQGQKHYEFTATTLTRQRMERELQEVAGVHAGVIFALGTLSPVLSDALRQRARSLVQAILFHVAVARMTDKAFDDAARVFMEVDDRLASLQRPEDNPRQAARKFAVWCLTRSSAYSVAKLPGPSAIQKAVEDGELAVSRYKDQFPYAIPLQARNLFFAGRLSEAMQVLNTLDLNRLIGSDFANTAIDFAVLHLFSGHWDEAANYFGRFAATGKFGEGADELVAFADYCAELDYVGAPFIQGLYRRWRDRAITDQATDMAALKWLHADKSRRKLEALYLQALPKKKRGARV